MSVEEKAKVIVDAKGLGISMEGTNVIIHLPGMGDDNEAIKINLAEGLSKASRDVRCGVAAYAFGLLKKEFDKIEGAKADAEAKKKAEAEKAAKAAQKDAEKAESDAKKKADADKKALDDQAAKDIAKGKKAKADASKKVANAEKAKAERDSEVEKKNAKAKGKGKK